MTTKAPVKTTPKEPEKPKNLFSKLAEIMGLMGNIAKEGFNPNQKYKFVRESDVAAKASELLSERNIFILQSVEETKMEPLFESRSGSQMFLTTVRMGFQFIDGDSGAKSDIVHFWGTGADTGDKGIYKAMTGAEKYFLMKTFLISTGDDPEADDKVDKESAAKGAKKGAKVSGKASSTAKRGGKTDEISSAQMKVIGELITAKGVSPVGYLAVVSLTVDVPEGSDPNVVTKGLTAKQAAEVIKALGELGEPEAAEAAGVTSEHDGDSEGMSIV
jgi:hypothetical protein